MADKRLFFALWPDDRQRETLRDSLSPLVRQVEGRAVPRTNWHVTLVFVGPFPEERVGELATAAGEIEAEPLRLRFDRLVFWQRPRIAALQAMTVPPGLQRLVDRLNATIAQFGVEVETAAYRPHITAVRAARNFEPIVLARPLEMSFSGFELVESIPDTGGARYSPVKQ